MLITDLRDGAFATEAVDRIQVLIRSNQSSNPNAVKPKTKKR